MELRSKKLLLIGCGRPGRTNVLRSLRSIGLSWIVCLHNEVTWAKDYVDDWIICDSERLQDDTEDLQLDLPSNFDRSHLSCKQVRLILKYQQEKNIEFDGVYTYDDYSVMLCSYISDVFGWRGLALEFAEKIKNKVSWRELCEETKETVNKAFLKLDQKEEYREAHVKFRYVVPRHTILEEENMKLIETFDFPVVIKPSLGAGKIAVRKVYSFSELRKQYEESKFQPKPLGDLLVEEYFEGDEVDIDMLVQDHELKFACITDNFQALGDNFMEAGGQIPANVISREEKEALLCMAKEFSKCGLRDGCLHFEARSRKKEQNKNGQQNFIVEVMAIEMNLRIGGAEVFSFVLSAHAVDLVQQSVRISLDLPVLLPNFTPNNFSEDRASYKADRGRLHSHFTESERNKTARYCCSVNFQAPCSGFFSCARFPQSLLSEENLLELVIFCQPGVKITAPPEGNSYLGWMVVSGSSPQAALANLRFFSSLVNFDIAQSSEELYDSSEITCPFAFSSLVC